MSTQLTDQRPGASPATDGFLVSSVLELSTPALMSRALEALAELTSRLEGPEALRSFRRLQEGGPSGMDWTGHLAPEDSGASESDTAPTDVAGAGLDPAVDQPSLPEVSKGLGQIGRAVQRLEMLVAGHVHQAFQHSADWSALLGMPERMNAFRSSAHYLRDTLDIDLREARRRITRARHLTTQPAAVGQPAAAPRMPRLSAATTEAAVSWSSVDHIAGALESARTHAERGPADPQTIETVLSEGEVLLTEQARTVDPDGMRRVCARWTQLAQSLLHPDGDEPVDGDHDPRRGLFYRGRRHGLHRWMITADDLEHEILTTVAEAAANPRAHHPDQESQAELPGGQDSQDLTGPLTAAEHAPTTGLDTTQELVEVPRVPTDPRTPAQKKMNGLISALQGALSMLTGNGLPTTGGTRPQVMVHIDYTQLLDQLHTRHTTPADTPPDQTPDQASDFRPDQPPLPGTGTAVPPRLWRACGYAASGMGVAVDCS